MFKAEDPSHIPIHMMIAECLRPHNLRKRAARNRGPETSEEESDSDEFEKNEEPKKNFYCTLTDDTVTISVLRTAVPIRLILASLPKDTKCLITYIGNGTQISIDLRQLKSGTMSKKKKQKSNGTGKSGVGSIRKQIGKFFLLSFKHVFHL